jgi:DNA-binding MarR family transcriptional regulator
MPDSRRNSRAAPAPTARRASARRRPSRTDTRSGRNASHDVDSVSGVDDLPTPGRQVDMGKMHGYLGYLLRRAQMLAYADFIAELAELNLSPGQFGVLTVIDTNPGLRQSEVSAALGIQKTNFVAVLNEFERRGLAVRRPATGDRRSYALHLTTAGKALLRRARAAQARHEARLVEPLAERERAQLLGLLAKLTHIG